MSDLEDDRLCELPKAGDGVVFYGSLMRGLGALDALPSRYALRYVGPCQVQGKLYDLGPYPGLREIDATATSGRETRSARVVQAELHSILDTRVVEELDHFEGYEPGQPEASLYLRKRVPLLSPTDRALTGNRAWVYIYNDTPDPSQRVDSGDWRAHILTRAQSDSGGASLADSQEESK